MYIVYIRDLNGDAVSLKVRGTESAYTTYRNALELVIPTGAYVALIDEATGKLLTDSEEV